MNNAATLSIIMFIAGVGIPVFAALNGGLGTRLDNPNFAALLLFAVGLVITGLITLSGELPSAQALLAVPVHFFFGGIFVITYVLTMTWIGPKIGIGNAVFFVLFGQIFAAAVIDHLALLGAPHSPITPPRLLGLLLMTVGVFLARRPDVAP